LAVLELKIVGLIVVAAVIVYIIVLEVLATRADRERDRRDGYR
jgi:uncharacterized membrane protein